MRRGDFRAAHAISDAVLAARDPRSCDDPGLPYHVRWVWDGSRPRGKDVLVRCYHGLGDTIQFARFLPLLEQQAASVTVEAQPPLISLIAAMPGRRTVIPFRPDAPAKPKACNIEIMELAHALRVAALPGEVPYLRAHPARMSEGPWCDVGLCWRAGDWDPARSVPCEALQQACALPGVRTWSLQTRHEDLATAAALLAALDIVVTVDTMIAHLAGAMARPTLLLLRRESDWRWMEGRARSPWYPTMRLFRQRREGDWAEPLVEMRAALAAMTARAEAG